jgi:hypothetical protein
MNPRTIGWIAGGVLCATGILTLLFSFDSGGADIALSLDRVGFDAMGDVGPNGNFVYAAACIALGLPTLVYLNATQWRNTGGY